jgi:8-hydroxy-5-deazaflavin:NADPH oxidoreductase
MKIAVLGSGQVGTVLANGFLATGHEVMRGSREPQKLADWQASAAAGRARIGTFAEAAEFGEVIVLAVKGDAALAVLDAAGLERFRGKVVIDPTNPIAEAPPQDGVLSFFTNINFSLHEILQEKAPEARFVKCFSCVGNSLMYRPILPGGPPSMFICGNDAAAKTQVTQLLTEFGWETVDLGSAPAARAIEPLCILWCIPGFRNQSWYHALKLLKPA